MSKNLRNQRRTKPDAARAKAAASRRQRPFVLINMAMTADGKIATANRAVSSFGSKRDHDHLLALRATADAVMCGARTADLNDINLGPGPKQFRILRRKRRLAEYNLRLIVSGSGSINPAAEVFSHRFSPIIILTTGRMTATTRRRLAATGATIRVCGRREINFRATLRWLRQQWNVRRLLCEGGGELNAAWFEAGLVDELHLTVCPKIFGGRRAPTIADGDGFPTLAQAARLTLKSARRKGDELFLIYTATPPQARSARRNDASQAG